MTSLVETQRGGTLDILCLSHLRWNFVFQRPQQLMIRLARGRRIFFFEEPEFHDGATRLRRQQVDCGIEVLVPQLARELAGDARAARRAQAELLDRFIAAKDLRRFVSWYYTPMALSFSAHLAPRLVVYDCMDELSAFAGAAPNMRELESELLARADLVLTGGSSLFEAKRGRHHAVHLVPSSVDAAHFRCAREPGAEPHDQIAIPRPRVGYAGVIDERIDLELIADAARAARDVHWVMIGPVAKIDPQSLPRAPNLHYLGMKAYTDLPAYMRGWEAGLLPFSKNRATQFISPTKTPEYLAAGLPVVSTSIRDVVRPYAKQGLVHIADTGLDFARAIKAACRADRTRHCARADAHLATNSWDQTAARIARLLDEAVDARELRPEEDGVSSERSIGDARSKRAARSRMDS
jgi:glycosyltransferase involved in cell wall biosynthesis